MNTQTHDNKCVEETANFWSRKTGKRVSSEDAREMLVNVSGFFATLLAWDSKERNCPITSEHTRRAETCNKEA